MNNDTIDIMLDVESLGLSNKPVLAQLSAVAFKISDGVTLGEFNKMIKPQSGVKVGLSCAGLDSKGGTCLDWWLTQDDATFKNVIVRALLEGEDLPVVLSAFSNWVEEMKQANKTKTAKVYGNGPAADCVWVRSAYEACGLKAPWMFFDDACVRTYVDIGRRVFSFDPKKEIPFVGDKHDAIADCKHQIKYVTAIYNKIQGAKK